MYLPALPTLSHATYDTPNTDFGSEALGRKRAPHAPSRLGACSDPHRLLDMVSTSYGDVPSPVLAECEHAEACVLRFGLVHRKPQASPRASQMRLTLHAAYTELSDASCVLRYLRRGRLGPLCWVSRLHSRLTSVYTGHTRCSMPARRHQQVTWHWCASCAVA